MTGGLTSWERRQDSIWRPARDVNPGLDQLLRHLREAGFWGAPQSLGLDRAGRLGVSWLTGESGSAEGDADARLISSARLIRAYHDAVQGFAAPDCLEPMVGAPTEGDLVCHNDLSPTNTVYDKDQAVGLIDFDLAGPGSRGWDLAYAAWRFVPLYDQEFFAACGVAMPDQARRLVLLLDAYGFDARMGFCDLICERIQSLYDTARVWGGIEHRDGWREVWHDTEGRQWLRSLRHVEIMQTDWAAALT
jgi:hypothetical protein